MENLPSDICCCCCLLFLWVVFFWGGGGLGTEVNKTQAILVEHKVSQNICTFYTEYFQMSQYYTQLVSVTLS